MASGKKHTVNSAALEERIARQRRLLELQLAVLNKQDFVNDALIALADADSDEGKLWDELKSELGLGRLPNSAT
jgi:hypothetical protein